MSSFERFRPAIAFYEAGTAAMAAWFGVEVANGRSPITPELYGPAVYAIDAIWWVEVQFIFGVASVIGCLLYAIRPVRTWRYLAALGCTGTGIVMALFTALSINQASGILVQAGSATIMTPLAMMSAWIAWTNRDNAE